MIKNYYFRFLIVPFLVMFIFQCTSPTKSNKTKTQVTVNNVWLTNEVDNDGDGYNSYLRLNFDLDVNREDSTEVFVILGARVSDPLDTATYYLYFESVDFKISGTGSGDGKYISIGSPNLEISMGAYDFLLEVYFSSNPNTRIAHASKTDDPDMGNIWIEEASTDVLQELEIYDAYWTNGVDNDGDGYYSQQDLIVDVDVNFGSANIYLEIFVRPTGTTAYNLAATTNIFSITGNSSGDAISTTIYNGSHDTYDFKIIAYFSGSSILEDEYDRFDDSDLGDVPFETVNEDPIVYNDWLMYHDGSFEDGYYWSTTTGYFAVRFDQPQGATSCVIKRIRFNIYENSASVRVRVWSDFVNTPNNYVYYTGAGEESYLYRYIWNTVYVDVDVSAYDPFYAGYYQYQTGMPIISADETIPLFGRSFYKSISASTVTNDTDGDYAIEVYVEYTTTAANNKSIVKGRWLSFKDKGE